MDFIYIFNKVPGILQRNQNRAKPNLTKLNKRSEHTIAESKQLRDQLEQTHVILNDHS